MPPKLVKFVRKVGKILIVVIRYSVGLDIFLDNDFEIEFTSTLLKRLSPFTTFSGYDPIDMQIIFPKLLGMTLAI
jgi:hypothetical protein